MKRQKEKIKFTCGPITIRQKNNKVIRLGEQPTPEPTPQTSTQATQTLEEIQASSTRTLAAAKAEMNQFFAAMAAPPPAAAARDSQLLQVKAKKALTTVQREAIALAKECLAARGTKQVNKAEAKLRAFNLQHGYN